MVSNMSHGNIVLEYYGTPIAREEVGKAITSEALLPCQKVYVVPILANAGRMPIQWR